MEFTRLCLLFAMVFMIEGKPFFTTEVTRTRVIIDCVTVDACASFGGIRNGSYRHPLNSNWFFTCFGTLRAPECQQCGGASLHFSEKCNMCINEKDDSAFTCPEVIKTVTMSLAPVICDTSYCQGQENGLYSDPADVTKFIQCNHEITYCNQCQTGLQFDLSCAACVYPTTTTTTTAPIP